MSSHEPLAFEFGGRLCLDFTWTLRYRAVYPTETLTHPARLTEWLGVSGLPAGRTTPDQLHDARLLREAIYTAALDRIDGKSLPTTHVRTINRWAKVEHPSPQLQLDGTRILTARRGHETQSALTAIACDAVELLAIADDRLRRCNGPSCSLLFHDTSRPGTRRWCSAERCGNKVNTKSYRARLDGARPRRTDAR
jgi:predicted RNA-binding Zn ribbon-like protein